MRKIKLFIIEFILFVYTKYIQEDWSIYKSWAKPIVYAVWLYRATVTWIFSFIFIPEFLFKRTKLYKMVKMIQSSPEFATSIMKSMKYSNFN